MATTAPIAPMLVSRVAAPPTGSGWVFEPKLDGYRIIALAGPRTVRLFSRPGRDVTDEFAVVAEAVRVLAQKAPHTPLVLDGEVVVQEGSEAPKFQRMQNFREHGTGTLRYYVFDVLRAGKTELTARPLAERRRHLEALIPATTRGVVRRVPRLRGAPKAAFHEAVAAGHEGIVAKRTDSIYAPGRRSESWVKVKRSETEDLVIGGFSRGQGKRSGTLGALLVGSPAPEGLRYAGHVGTGFNEHTLRALTAQLTALKTATHPFTTKPPLKGPTTWVRPEVVIEVTHAERTDDGIMRAPVFVRIRDDKVPTHADARLDRPAATPAVRAVLDQLDRLGSHGTLAIGRTRLGVTNLDKVLWPAAGDSKAGTKRDLLRYYAGVSAQVLAHLRKRPVTLARYPNGAGKPGFYQRHWDGVPPPYIKMVTLFVKDTGEDGDYVLVESLAALLHAGQLGALEVHPWYSRGGSDRPDFVVFDIDPYVYAGHERRGEEPAIHAAGFDAGRTAAGLLKEELDSLGLPAFVKTSGKTGLHVFVPIKRTVQYAATHEMARTICVHLERRHPKLLTTSWAVGPRRGKVFLDYNQNARGKTVAGAYSPRAAAGAPVSTPIEWEELETVDPAAWNINTVPARLTRHGDPWGEILTAAVDLRKL